MSKIKISIICLFLSLWMPLQGICSESNPNTHFSDNQAILAVIGEAEDQGYEGMYAIACAIRNRGTLKGVYGINSARVKYHKYSKTVYSQAYKAWQNSGNGSDITHGANCWGTKEAIQWLKQENLWNKCKITAVIYDHVFYKDQTISGG